MSRVYLLLRNNQQTGPYSLDELVVSGLKPDDLIWMEGKSVSWAFPHEIEVLKPYLKPVDSRAVKSKTGNEREGDYNCFPKEISSSNTANDKKIFVSLPEKLYPSTSIKKETKPLAAAHEKTEEPLQATSSPALPKVAATDSLLQNNYTRSLPAIEEDYTNWVYRQKTKSRKKVSSKVWALMVIALILLVTGFFIGKESFHQKETAISTSPVPQYNTTESEPSENQSGTVVPETQKEGSSATAKEPAFTSDHHSMQQKTNASLATKPFLKKNTPKVIEEPAAVVTGNKEELPVAETNNNNEPTAVPQKNETVKSPQKTKKFGERINDFFDKLKHKKDEDVPVTSDSKESSTTNTGERKSAHRGDETPATNEPINLTDLVSITANEPKDNWMLGIRGLKITLRNRSDETIKLAEVEVNYYSEDNKLLQTKKLQFRSIPPDKSATMPAPDHPLADHADYHVLSATN